MDSKGQVTKEFGISWMSMLNRDSAREIMRQRLTPERMISKLLAKFLDEDYGQLYNKWYDEAKKARELEKSVSGKNFFLLA